MAIKSLRESFKMDRDSILQEAALMAQFDCDFVVRLIGVVTTGDPLLLILEYCQHGLPSSC